MVTATWFGGMAWVSHYTPRLFMRTFGYAPSTIPASSTTPPPNSASCRKSAEATPLYMHRYLQEYFAQAETHEFSRHV
jgi:hypothetical protein